jgi:predicted nucleic acid-binding Zn ribbon protein
MENDRKKRMEPKPLKGIARQLLAQWTKKVQKTDQFYDSIWKEVAGERVAGHTSIEKIVKGKAHILVENSMWMNELTFLKDKIKISLNKAFSNNGINIEEIAFKIGMIRKKSELSSDVPPLGK